MKKSVSNIICEAQYTIESLGAKGKYINVESGKSKNSQNIHLWNNPQELDSQWVIEKVKNTNNVFHIRFSKSQYHYMNVLSGGKRNGKNVHLYNNPDKAETKWCFDLIDTNSLRVAIRNFNSNLYLNCESNGTGNGTNIYQWSNPQYLSTQWYLHPLDLKLINISYDIDNALKGDSKPQALVSQTLSNSTSAEQTQNWSVSETVTTESWFEYTSGFKVSFGVSVESSGKVGVPAVSGASEKVTVSTEIETSYNWTNGEKNISSKTFSINQPVKVAAQTSVKCIATYKKCQLDVPYKMTFQSKSVGKNIIQSGVWHGVSAYNLVSSFQETSLN